MGLLGKNTNKTSFFFVKRQKNNQKVVLFIVFVYFCTRKIRCRIIFMNITIDNRTLTQTSVCARLKAHWELRYSSVLMILNKITLNYDGTK